MDPFDIPGSHTRRALVVTIVVVDALSMVRMPGSQRSLGDTP